MDRRRVSEDDVVEFAEGIGAEESGGDRRQERLGPAALVKAARMAESRLMLIGDRPAVESDRHLAEIEIDGFDVADVAIIDLLVIVIFDLHVSQLARRRSR